MPESRVDLPPWAVAFISLFLIVMGGAHLYGLSTMYCGGSCMPAALTNWAQDDRVPFLVKQALDVIDGLLFVPKAFAALQAAVFFDIRYELFNKFCDPPYISGDNGTRVAARECVSYLPHNNKLYLNDTYALLPVGCERTAPHWLRKSSAHITRAVNVMPKAEQFNVEIVTETELRLYPEETASDREYEALQYAYAMFCFADFIVAKDPTCQHKRVLIVSKDNPDMITVLSLTYLFTVNTWPITLEEAFTRLQQANPAVRTPPPAALHVLQLYGTSRDWQEVGRVLLEELGFSDVSGSVFMNDPHRMVTPSLG